MAFKNSMKNLTEEEIVSFNSILNKKSVKNIKKKERKVLNNSTKLIPYNIQLDFDSLVSDVYLLQDLQINSEELNPLVIENSLKFLESISMLFILNTSLKWKKPKVYLDGFYNIVFEWCFDNNLKVLNSYKGTWMEVSNKVDINDFPFYISTFKLFWNK